MRNRKTGVKVTPSGNVTVSQPYNPRMLALLAEEISIEELDDEELARGMCRNPDGSWPRRQVNMIPRSMYNRMTTELFQRSDDRLREGLVEAVEAVVKMMGDTEVDASTRLKAATWVFERLRGKTPEIVEVRQDKPYQVVLNHIHRGPREKVVEGEVVEEPKAPPQRKLTAGKRPVRGPR